MLAEIQKEGCKKMTREEFLGEIIELAHARGLEVGTVGSDWAQIGDFVVAIEEFDRDDEDEEDDDDSDDF